MPLVLAIISLKKQQNHSQHNKNGQSGLHQLKILHNKKEINKMKSKLKNQKIFANLKISDKWLTLKVY